MLSMTAESLYICTEELSAILYSEKDVKKKLIYQRFIGLMKKNNEFMYTNEQ